MKDYLLHITRIIPILLLLCTIAVLLIKSIFDDRYIKKPKSDQFRYITKKEFDDHKELETVKIDSLKDKINSLKG